MQIIYTCPKCGHDLQELMLPSNPPQYEKRCPNCGWNHIEKQDDGFVRIPYNEMNYVDGSWECTMKYAYIPSPCKACSNHPSNGGSGICNCILGLQPATC